VLFSTPVLAYPPAGGPPLRIANSIKALSRVADVYLHSRAPLSGRGMRFFARYCAEIRLVPSVRPLEHFVRRAVNAFSRRLLARALARPDEAADCRDLIDFGDGVSPDVVWLGYGNISYPLLRRFKERNRRIPVVLDTDSVWSRFIGRQIPFVADERQRRLILESSEEKEAEERWGTALADVTTAVSEVDARYYEGLAGSPGKVLLFSNCIDMDDYADVPAAPPGLRTPAMCLAGTFWPGSPMDDAARWVIGQVLPLVKRRVPRAHLYVVGRGSDRVLANIRDPAVTVVGAVGSVLPYLCHAGVALVPLRFESGTRFKILEAGACGVPVVSTILGAEGLPVEHGESVLLADTPGAFAEAIATVVSDRSLAERLGGHLRQLVRERFGLETLAAQASVVLRRCGALKRPVGAGDSAASA